MGFFERLEPRFLPSAWYVWTHGSDSQDGSARQPFATISRAAEVARPGDTVYIRGGVYRETVVPSSSGTAAAPITYRAFRNQMVTIDGSDPVGTWTGIGAHRFQASLPWDLGDGQNQLFSNGRMLAEARWPNSPPGILNLWKPTFASVAEANTQASASSSGTQTATLAVPQLTDPAGAWVGATIHIAQGQQWVFQTGTVIASSPGTLTYTYTALRPTTYQSPSAGDRFYLTGSPAGLDAPGEWYRDSTGTLTLESPTARPPRGLEAKHRLYGFDLSGLSYINLVGINLFACTINTSSSSNHLTISGMNARYVSHDLVSSDPWADQYHPHTSGIILNGTENLLTDSTIDYSSGDGVFLGGSNNTVQNTLIADSDYSGADEAGVTIMGSGDRVIGNTILKCGRSAVVARYSTALVIDGNRILDAGLLTTDVGGIYTWQTDGRATEIAYNLVSDIHTGGFGGVGIYLDNGSSNYLVHHNVVWNVDVALKMNPPSPGNRIDNNTLAGSQYSVTGSATQDMTGSIFTNNIFMNAAKLGTGASQSNNLFNPPTSGFVSPARGDFRLRHNSPAVNAGTAEPPYTNRYVGSAPDQGAYEYGLRPFWAGSKVSLKKLNLRIG